jgi:hypothetical protein
MRRTERIIKMCQHFNEPVCRNDFEPAASKRCEKIRQGRDDAEGDIQRTGAAKRGEGGPG